jgi:hypothetical protein
MGNVKFIHKMFSLTHIVYTEYSVDFGMMAYRTLRNVIYVYNRKKLNDENYDSVQ